MQQIANAHHPDYAQYDPLPAPDWRYQRARQLYRAGKFRAGRWDDKEIRTYFKLLRDFDGAVKLSESNAVELGDAPDTDMLDKLFAKKPGLWCACRMHRDGAWRTLIEARILARQTDAQIAQGFHTGPDTIFWYEKIFFNVRDRLDCDTWIYKAALKSSAGSAQGAGYPSSIENQARELKRIAYFGGKAALDQQLTGFPNIKQPTTPDEAQEWFGKVLASLVRSKAMNAMSADNIDSFNTVPLAARALKRKAVKKPNAMPNAELEKRVQLVLDEIPWELSLGTPKKT